MELSRLSLPPYRSERKHKKMGGDFLARSAEFSSVFAMLKEMVDRLCMKSARPADQLHCEGRVSGT